MQRSNLPLKDFIVPEQVQEYLNQFKNAATDNFNGKSYIKKIIVTLRKLGVEI